MPNYDLGINIKSQSDTGAIQSIDEALVRLQRAAGDLNQRLASVSQGGGQAERVMASMSGEARSLNDRLLAVSQGARQTGESLEQVGDAGQQAAQGLEQATKAAGDAERAADRAGKGAQASGLQWANVAGALYTVQAAYQTVRRGAELAYQTIREGAELDWGERKFENLARAIGTNGDQLLSTLERTTMGLLSQAEAMRLAADLIGLQLVGTEEEAARLSGVVAGLGMDTNQLVLTLTNQTTARFDQLGVAVGGFEERLKRLEAQGLSTDKAFLWAFIEQAEESMARAGSRADELTGHLDILEATWSDAVVDMKQDAAATAEPIIDWLVEIIEKAREAQNEIDRLNNETPEDRTTSDEWLRFIRETDAVIGTGVKLNLVGQLDEVQATQQEAILNYAKMVDSAEEFEQAMLNGYEPSKRLFQVIPEGAITWSTIYSTATESQREFFREMEIDSLEAFHAWARLQQQAEQADAAMLNSARAWADGFRGPSDAAADYSASLEKLAQDGRSVAQSTQEQDRWFREVEARIEQQARHTALLNAETTDYVYTLERLAQNGREGIETLDLTADEMEAAAAAAAIFDEAVAAADESLLGYFETIRGGGELDYNEIFYNAAIAAGASARAVADLMVAQGQWTQQQADAKVAAAELGTQVEILGATWQSEGLTAEEAALAHEYLTTGLFDNAEAAMRAAEHGSIFAGTLESEVSPSLRTGRDAAQDYGDALGGVPEGVTTQIETPGMEDAKTDADDYYESLINIPEDVTTEVSAPGIDRAIEDARMLGDHLRNIPREVTSTIRVVTFASGGAYDPGQGTYVPPSTDGEDDGGNLPYIPEFAGGTDGWLRVPGPVGAPRLIQVHGGEGLNVSPGGVPAGGGGDTINQYNISLIIDGRKSTLPVTASDAEPFLNAARMLGVAL